jgi:2-iminobutanoate/2-iminopropanoate deaminase
MLDMVPPETTPPIPKAIGPYSLAVEAGGFLFLSGQIPLDPVSGQMVQGSVEEQAERVFQNIAAILGTRQLTLQHIIKTTLFLRDLQDFDRVNGVYARHFPTNPPARSTVQAARLPKDAAVEIEAVAFLGAR